MKRNLKALVVAVAAILAVACQKDDDATPLILDVEVDEVADYIVDELLPIDVQGGTEDNPFSLRVEEEFAGARILTNAPSFPILGLGYCADKLDLTEDQIKRARTLASSLLDCRKDVHEKFRNELKKIIEQMEAARKEAIQKLRKEEITPLEFRAEMENLRRKHEAAMKEIREKHRETIKPCVRDYVKQLKELLGKENWEKLRACLKAKNQEREKRD